MEKEEALIMNELPCPLLVAWGIGAVLLVCVSRSFDWFGHVALFLNTLYYSGKHGLIPEILLLSGYGMASLLAFQLRQNRQLKNCVIRYQELEKELRFFSCYDTASGTLNRNSFHQEIEALESSREPMGVLVCDIDCLKLINDTLGHDAGDVLIRETANILNAACPAPAKVFRVGGDEFVVILPGVKREQELEFLHANIKKAIESYNAVRPGFPLSISIGYALSESGGDLFKLADINMYAEKRACRERVREGLFQTLVNQNKF